MNMSLNIDTLKSDLIIIKSTRPRSGDKLAVSEDGHLIVTPNDFFQGPFRTLNNLFCGGYNRDSVAQKLNFIADETVQILAAPRFQRDEFQEFATLAHKAEKKMSAIALQYHQSVQNDPAAISIRKSRDKIANALASLKENTGIVPKEKTVKERLDTIDHSIDKLLSSWHICAHTIAQIALMTFLCTPLVWATLIKLILWNPIEYLMKGRITAENPLSYFFEKCKQIFPTNNAFTLMKIEKQTRRIFQGNFELTADELGRVCNKALPYVKSLDLGWIKIGIEKNDIDTLWETIEEEHYQKEQFTLEIQQYIAEKCRQAEVELIDPKNFKGLVEYLSLYNETHKKFDAEEADVIFGFVLRRLSMQEKYWKVWNREQLVQLMEAGKKNNGFCLEVIAADSAYFPKFMEQQGYWPCSPLR